MSRGKNEIFDESEIVRRLPSTASLALAASLPAGAGAEGALKVAVATGAFAERAFERSVAGASAVRADFRGRLFEIRGSARRSGARTEPACRTGIAALPAGAGAERTLEGAVAAGAFALRALERTVAGALALRTDRRFGGSAAGNSPVGSSAGGKSAAASLALTATLPAGAFAETALEGTASTASLAQRALERAVAGASAGGARGELSDLVGSRGDGARRRKHEANETR